MVFKNLGIRSLQKKTGVIFFGITNKYSLILKHSVYYKSYFEAGVVHISDLSFDLNNKDSFSLVSNRISKTNFLVWAGLPHSIPSILKNSTYKSKTGELSLKIDDTIFDVTKKKSKRLLYFTCKQKGSFSNYCKQAAKCISFYTRQIFTIPHSVALEAYVQAFQYKILLSILYSNAKLYKISFNMNESCPSLPLLNTFLA